MLGGRLIVRNTIESTRTRRFMVARSNHIRCREHAPCEKVNYTWVRLLRTELRFLLANSH